MSGELPEYVEYGFHQWFTKAPCFLCGYKGEGYYQPDKHPCAEHYHNGTLGKAWKTQAPSSYVATRTPPSGGEETMGGFPVDRSGINPLLTIVKKAVDMGLVKIEMCEACRGSGDLITDFSEYDICKNCSGNGFTITEGDAK